MKPTPFALKVSDDQLAWITDRVKTARLPPPKNLEPGHEWDWGMPHDVATRMQKYWANQYDWRLVEAKINRQLKMFTLPISHEGEDLSIHFVHHVSPSPDAIPLLFLHGWPGSFLEVQPIIDELVNPSSPTSQAYHVVAPSLPGFGFSSYPKAPFNITKMTATMNKLMLALGYDKYIAQGGDWGSMLVRVLGHNHSEHCVGIHLNFLASPPPSVWRAPFTLAKLVFCYVTGWWGEFDGKMLKRATWWMQDEAGYFTVQGTKPLTLAHTLTDSPFGTLCWIREKVNGLREPDFEWEDEEIITWSMVRESPSGTSLPRWRTGHSSLLTATQIYILNGTAGPYETYKWGFAPPLRDDLTAHLSKPIGKEVPVGVSVFPKDVFFCPRWWAESVAASNITFWKEHKKGGHFASVENPDELTEDIREFTAVSKISEKIHA
jgi:pimeloyl-ACP methyl ester carboxylesterase